MRMPHFVAGILSLGLMDLNAGIAFGQSYPAKPIRIVTAEAGGANDFAARLIIPGLHK